MLGRDRGRDLGRLRAFILVPFGLIRRAVGRGGGGFALAFSGMIKITVYVLIGPVVAFNDGDGETSLGSLDRSIVLPTNMQCDGEK